MALPRALVALATALRRLPGIGPRPALRLCFFLFRYKPIAQAIALALKTPSQKIHLCPKCFRLISTGEQTCTICANRLRRKPTLAIVEEDIDADQLEKTGAFQGLYFILGGRFSPRGGALEQQGLRINELKARIMQEKDFLEEIVLATNPTADGDALTLYLLRELKPFGIKTTRLGRGLPLGGEIEHADEETLKGAIEHRT